MYREKINYYSHQLDKEMHILIYGHDGLPFLAFPTQNSMCESYEDFGMIDAIADYLESGKIRYFVVDTVDMESWSPFDGEKSWRSARQEQYYRHITEEIVPFVLERTGGWLPFTTGCSLGANHALNMFLRRPDLFTGTLALSGVYDSDCFFQGWMDDNLYMNSPERYLPNMSAGHPYIDLYNQKDMILCVGQGAWEEEGVRTLRNLQRIFEEKGISVWCDFWGHDVNHDWPWWFKQMQYFIPILLERFQIR